MKWVDGNEIDIQKLSSEELENALYLKSGTDIFGHRFSNIWMNK